MQGKPNLKNWQLLPDLCPDGFLLSLTTLRQWQFLFYEKSLNHPERYHLMRQPVTLQNNPLVSVILPLYNGERFVRKAVNSVLRQTYPHFELLIIDDGSDDKSQQQLPEDHRIRLFTRSNHGVAATRNFGIKLAKGELIAFIDQDDQWHPEKLAFQVKHMLQNPDTGYLLTMMQNVLTGNTECPYWLKPELLEGAQLGLLPSSLMVKKEVFDRIGTFDEQLVNSSDSDWIFRADRNGIKRSVVDKVLLTRNIHDQNRSSDHEINKKEMFIILRRQIAARKRQETNEQ